ncbi:MAG: pyridoxamine kinase [Clostridia bacterium]|nr:pyridoxamine kinase [Clostridia bacterium]
MALVNLSENKYRIKKCAAIHDFSGYGKCSLAVVIPIMNACCVQTASVPTAVFSNHTAFPEYYAHDLTEHMMPIAKTWEKLNLKVDAVYTGFLGSLEQIQIVSDIIDMFTEENRKDKIVFVDPVMGDNGVLYKTYTNEMADGVKSLCEKADIISPNMTEASRILGIEYNEGPYTPEYVESVLKGLLGLGVKCAVLTGVRYNDEEIGAAAMGTDGKMFTAFAKRFPGFFQGTGDVFASVMLGQLLSGKSIEESLEKAVSFTGKAISNTVESGFNPLEGVIFEPELKTLSTM